MHVEPERYEVVIAGGGPAGFAAGLFTARYQLSTLILDRGKSLLKQCAYLDNYLGFPNGIDVTAFLTHARAHAEEAGCRIAKRRVLEVRHATDGRGRFVVETDSGAPVIANRLLAATGHGVDYLRALDVAALFDAEGDLRTDAIDREGRTIVDGLYAAGPIAGVENQALIAAGHGAQVALGLVRDVRVAEGRWDALARHLDWQVREGTYESTRWARRVHDYFDSTVPDDCALDHAARRELIEAWIRAKRAQQVARDEVERRRARAREHVQAGTS